MHRRILVILGVLLIKAVHGAPPLNDLFSDRIPLPSEVPASVTGQLTGATREVGEPFPWGGYWFTSESSIWWCWVAPSSEWFNISVSGDKSDGLSPLVYVYTGDRVDTLQLAGLSNEQSASSPSSNAVQFSAVAGKEYQICVFGSDDDVRLTVETVPEPGSNDQFADRIDLGSSPHVSVPGNLLGATSGDGERGLFFPSTSSVWYEWTAPDDGLVQIGNAVVFQGSRLQELKRVNPLGIFFSLDAMQIYRMTRGESYKIAVTGGASNSPANRLSAPFRLEIHPFATPANGDFANAIDLGSSEMITISGNNYGIDPAPEPDEPLHARSGTYPNSSVWWKWTAPRNRSDLALEDHYLPLKLFVYEGNSLSGLREVIPPLNFTAGTEYYFAVAAASESIPPQTFQFQIGGSDAPIGNDDFADAIDLGSVAPVEMYGISLPSTFEPGEPQTPEAQGSIWWRWTAPSSGWYIFGAYSQLFNTTTQVYSGNKVNQLTPVAANRGGYDSSSRYPFRPCYFRATAGEELYLALYEDGISDRQIDNSVTGWIKPVPVATNDAFDAAIELASRKEGIQFFASPGATWDAQEPGGPREHGTLLWWRWTAPEDGSAMLLLRAGEEQTVNVYTGQDPASLKPIELNDSDPLDGNSSGLKLARTFDVTAGTEYRLAIGRDRGVPIDSEDWSDSNDPWAQSAFNLGMVRRPVNDNIADAIDLGNDRAILAWSTSVLATQEPNEPVGLEPQRPRTLWWTWTAPETGSYWISDGPDYNIGATCEVFIANEDGSLQLVRTGFRGLSQYPHSHCMLRATRGVRYTIKIGTYNQMPVQINIREAFAFENDFFGDAIDLGQVNVAHSVVSGYGASSEFDELHVANGTGTIWWRWTAPATESYQITVGPSDSSHSRIKPPILTVYQGNQLANLKSIAVSSTGIIELDANAGEEYVLGWQSGDSSVRQVSLKLLRSFFGQGGPFEPFPDQSRPFEYWIAQFPELSAEQRTPEASPASDGATNWLKFYFGLDPTQRLSTPGILPQISIVEDGAAAIEYQVSKGGVSAREQGMLQDILQYSVDGKRWTNVPANARKSARMGNRQLWLIPHDDAAPQMYFRVKIESTQQ